MTKEEIKAIVAAKIAGQGSAIDAASVLPTVIDALCDLVDAQAQQLEKALMPIDIGPMPTAVKEINQEMVNALRSCCAISLGGTIYPQLSAAAIMDASYYQEIVPTVRQPDTVFAIFGRFSNSGGGFDMAQVFWVCNDRDGYYIEFVDY